ncbi:MAG: AMP-binding protein [Treponema sp.]|nr:AMP-binding protein [Treponema sp.]
MLTEKDLKSKTFPEFWNLTVSKYADNKAVAFALDMEKFLTYRQLDDLQLNVAKLFTALGIGAGEKIAIWSAGCPNWGASYFAAVNHGFTAVPLLPDFSANELSTIFKHCEVKALIAEESLLQRFEKCPENLPELVINISDFSLIKGNKNITLESVKENKISEATAKEDDIASIIYTSGTTGRSKGVVLTHKNLISNLLQAQTIFPITEKDVSLSFLPLSHVYEFTAGFTYILSYGACIYYLAKPPVVSALLKAFKDVRPTCGMSVPLVMEKIYKNAIKPNFEKNKVIKFLYEISLFRKLLHRIAGKKLMKTMGGRFKFFGIGGARLDPVVERFLKEAKFPYAIGYGLTETSPLISVSNPQQTVCGTIGLTLPGVDMKILNPNEMGFGEVVVKGDNVMAGYYKDEEMTKAAFTTKEDSCGEGYFKTGDLGCLAEKKGVVRLSLKGRNKNMILGPSGENIYPEDIEFVLNQNSNITESLVVMGKKGLRAIIKLHDNVHTRREELRTQIKTYINERVSRSSRIEEIDFITEFEKTATQKIKRFLYEVN